MKKYTLSTLLLSFSIAMLAGPVDKQAALYTAKSFMLEKGKSLNGARLPYKAPRKASAQQTSEEADAYYYVFNADADGGYVIVSGDDRVEPILGYVEQGSFDPNNIPENMKAWLQGYTDQIKYIVENNIQPESPLLRKRNKVRATKHSVAELLKTRWNQGHPYNLTCPNYYTNKDNDLHKYPATGCTATAMAQTINFYKFPEKTKAIIPALTNNYTLLNGTSKSVTAKAIPRNTAIDWEYLRDTYNCDDNHIHDRADTAVAQLMLMCGQAVNMGYGPSSGANFWAEAFTKYFGFDNSCYIGNRNDYSIDDWFDMIYGEIEQGYPVCFAGFSSGGGHAFVLDGFDGDNLFHVNWGWGGGSNGYFLVSILNPGDNSGIGASSSSDGYSMGQYALFNLRLPDTDKADTYLSIKDVYIVNKTSIKATFENKTGVTGSFNTAIVRYDEKGELVVVGTQQNATSLANDASQTKTFVMKGRLEEGTYKLSPASKATRSKTWKPKYNLRNHYIEAVVDSAGNLTLTPVDINNTNVITIDTITFPGTRIAGKQQEVKVTYRNDADSEYFREVLMYATVNDSTFYTESRSNVAARKGEMVEVSYFFTPPKTGTYTLEFCTGWDRSGKVGETTMEVINESEAVQANLSVTAYSITNLVSGYVYGKQLIGTAKIKNNMKVNFNGKVRLTIWNMPAGSGWAYGGSSRTYDLDIMAGKIATVDFSFEGLSENNKYYIAASYVNQDGDLGNGGIWDLGGWDMKNGVALWKNNGTPTGKAYATTMTTATDVCGVYADCSKQISRMTPNKNPNTIYAFAEGMTIPAKLDTTSTANVVAGTRSSRIALVGDKPYYIPQSFEADTASFTYTFPEDLQGSGWSAITMPFEVDSIFVDGLPIELQDSINHFWIYEYAAQGDDANPIFSPARVLRGATPYIIAADSTMAGRSIIFRSRNVPFYKSGSDKMVVTSDEYQFHGNTLNAKVMDCFVLNEEGTAFVYTSTNKTLKGLESYFTTNLPDDLRPDSIALPEVPEAKRRDLMLAETDSVEFAANTYTQVTLRRSFQAGWNTICLPFDLEDPLKTFSSSPLMEEESAPDVSPLSEPTASEGACYEFYDFVGTTAYFTATDCIQAGKPYIVYLPEAWEGDIVLNSVLIPEDAIQPWSLTRAAATFSGTYCPIAADAWSAAGQQRQCYGLNADGTLSLIGDDTSLSGFRAFFFTEQAGTLTDVRFADSPTAIEAIHNTQTAIHKSDAIYNLAGQRLVVPQKGINIVAGKKVLVK